MLNFENMSRPEMIAARRTIRTDPAGDPVQRAGSRASGGKMGKRKRPGQTARRALLLWPLVCTGGNGSGGVRPGAGGHGQRWHRSRWRRSSVTAGAGGAPSGSILPFAGGVRFST